MPFTAHFGEAADKENERRNFSYEQMVAVAARNLVDEASKSLQSDIAMSRREAACAVDEIRRMVHWIYTLLGLCVALLVSAALVVVLHA